MPVLNVHPRAAVSRLAMLRCAGARADAAGRLPDGPAERHCCQAACPRPAPEGAAPLWWCCSSQAVLLLHVMRPRCTNMLLSVVEKACTQSLIVEWQISLLTAMMSLTGWCSAVYIIP